MTDLTDWIGRQERTTDTIDLELVRRMSATLDRNDNWRDGDVLPVTWHWLFLNEIGRQSKVGLDGHPQRGNFLPPVTQPRRMWAGCRLQWLDSFRVGDVVERESTILDVAVKNGRTGEMVLVTVQYLYRSKGQVLLREEQDIVYRAESTLAEREALVQLASRARAGGASLVPQRPAAQSLRMNPDPVQLFRYSAVTFNGHRIHYDAPYAMNVERYPGLLVHGTLLATMLIEFLQSAVCPGQSVQRYEFSLRRPTFDIADFYLHASTVDAQGKVLLWTTDNVGEVALDGWAVCGPPTSPFGGARSQQPDGMPE
ncbi:MAG: acyl-CoA dehydrogenase [Comamonadaceae bacterium]|nr:MAG: acyl-CoA dehydrogenase [Comamonadaceae bacterium]